jgi:hypothetical protein
MNICLCVCLISGSLCAEFEITSTHVHTHKCMFCLHVIVCIVVEVRNLCSYVLSHRNFYEEFMKNIVVE